MMTESPVRLLVLRLAAPTIISMLVSSIYSMVDTFFVAQLGTSAAGAVGIVFSVMASIQAIGFAIGMGAGTLASRQLGAKNDKEANMYASTGVFIGLVVALVIAVLGFVFVSPLMKLLGATSTILPYAEDYARYIFLSTPFMCLSFLLNNYLRVEGKALYGMIGIISGALLNIALDPVFIFVLGLGTRGAAIATSISQVVSFAVLLTMFLKGRSGLRLSPRYISFKVGVWSLILYTGLPSFARQGLASLSTIALNIMAAMFGDPAVAAVAICYRVMYALFSFMLGLGQGYQPVAAFNYGAERYDRVYGATRFTVRLGSLVMLVCAFVCFVFAPEIVRAFRKDDLAVIAIGTAAIRSQSLVVATLGLTTVTNMGLQSTASSGKATILAMGRQGIFFLPCVLVLPHLIGLGGVIVSQAIADICTFVLAIFLYRGFLEELKGHMYAQKAERIASNL